MDEHNDDAQLEMLAKIHNQLVDLKKLLVEIELSRPGTSGTLQTRLRQIIGTDQHIDAEGRSGGIATRQQKVISPTNTDIQPGEAIGGAGLKK